MTLVEVVIAMALSVMLCAGLYAVVLKAEQFADHNRLATEARSLAKERLEEMFALGAENLAKFSCTLLGSDTNLSSTGGTIVRRPHLVWHTADGGVTDSVSAAYAEVHVDVSYSSSLIKRRMTNSYSVIVGR